MAVADSVEPTIDATAQTATYKLSLSGHGVSVERQVSEDVALRVIALTMGGDRPPLSPLASAAAQPGPTRRLQAVDLSVGEFLTEVEAKRNPDKIVGIGVYLHDQIGRATFAREDVKAQFQAAGESPPANFSRDFNWALGAKWLAAPSGAPKEFYVTKTGRAAVDAHFSSEIIKASAQGKAIRRRSTRKKPEET
jgi:hypothetical protein